MEIAGHVDKLKLGVFNTFQGKVEELVVVSLKAEIPAGLQKLNIFF